MINLILIFLIFVIFYLLNRKNRTVYYVGRESIPSRSIENSDGRESILSRSVGYFVGRCSTPSFGIKNSIGRHNICANCGSTLSAVGVFPQLNLVLCRPLEYSIL